MTYMIIGIILFLATHSVRMFADGWRSRIIAAIGEPKWKGVYSLLSLAGFVLLVWGYGEARLAPMVLYNPPLFTRHIAGLLMLLSFILLAAANVPGNAIKAGIGHPMVAGVKVWAFAHLLANGTLADVLLFGSFLAWAIVNFAASRKRDRAAGVNYPRGDAKQLVLTIGAGTAMWAVFAFWLHRILIGVAPFG
jgi:uncharacterized membrane protein